MLISSEENGENMFNTGTLPTPVFTLKYLYWMGGLVINSILFFSSSPIFQNVHYEEKSLTVEENVYFVS